MIRGLFLLLMMMAAACTQAPDSRPSPRQAARPKPRSPFDEHFWRHWSDGNVEVCRYDWSRGALKGTATSHVQLDDARVLTMILLKRAGEVSETTEVRMPLDGTETQAPGEASVISNSRQTPSGHTWEQAVFGARRAFVTRHATGQPDMQQVVEYGSAVLPAESAILWARRIAWPRIRTDSSMGVHWVASLAESTTATLRRTERAASVRGQDGSQMWFEVHPALPHHVRSWETSAGENATLLGCERVQPAK